MAIRVLEPLGCDQATDDAVATGHAFWSLFLPYCLIRQADGSYLVTNRSYLPLGHARPDPVENGRPPRIRFQRLTGITAGRLDHADRPNLDRIYLYDADCVPTRNARQWRLYSARLAALAVLQVESVPPTA